jgi:hypothetical protein
MQNRFVILFLFLFIQAVSFGQDIRLYQPSNDEDSISKLTADTVVKTAFDLDFKANDGMVQVNADNRIQSLIEYNGTPQNGQSVVKLAGFRLQIYYDQEKNNVNQKKADYLARYKDHPAYINYKAPNFRLRVGNFRTRLQAQEFMNEIKVEWPDAIIVEDDIELPNLN